MRPWGDWLRQYEAPYNPAIDAPRYEGPSLMINESIPQTKTEAGKPRYVFKCTSAKCKARNHPIPIEGSVPRHAVSCLKCGQPMPFFLADAVHVKAAA